MKRMTAAVRVSKGLLAALTAAMLLSACGSYVKSDGPEVAKLLRSSASGGASEDKVVLRLWTFHQAMEYGFWQSLAKEYEKEHPNVEVKVEYVSSDDYFSSTRLMAAFASGQGPDLFFVSPATIKRFAEAGILYSLTDYFTPAMKDDFYKAALDGVTLNQNIYAIPFETELLGLFYNKRMFAANHIEPPKTWQEMRRASERLKTNSVSGLTIETFSNVYQNFSWMPFLWQTGGDLLTEGGKQSALAGPQSLSMYAFFRSMRDRGLLNMRPSRPTTDIGILAAGETAMQVSGTWNIRMLETEFKNEPIGVVPLPVPEGGKPVTIAGGWKIAANARSEHADEAAKFMMWAFAGDPAIPLKWCSEIKFAYSPRKSVMAAGERIYRQGLRAVFTDRIFGTEREEPQLPEEINRIFADSLQELLFGDASPEEIVSKADRRIQNHLARTEK